jgi:hypothetical protein
MTGVPFCTAHREECFERLALPLLHQHVTHIDPQRVHHPAGAAVNAGHAHAAPYSRRPPALPPIVARAVAVAAGLGAPDFPLLPPSHPAFPCLVDIIIHINFTEAPVMLLLRVVKSGSRATPDFAATAKKGPVHIFYRAMSANVILSRHSNVAWCAKLAKFLAVIGVEGRNGTCIGHMDMGHPPGIACSVQCMICRTMDIRQTELHNATVQATYVRHFRTTPLGEVANMHGYLSTDLCAVQLPKKVVLSTARFRLSGHNLRIETGRHEGLPRNERSCCRCKRLLGEDFVAPIDDEEHLLFSCETQGSALLACPCQV